MQIDIDLEFRDLPGGAPGQEGGTVKGTIKVDAGASGQMLGEILTALLGEITKHKTVPTRQT